LGAGLLDALALELGRTSWSSCFLVDFFIFFVAEPVDYLPWRLGASL
jgi:hypothetical protein